MSTIKYTNAGTPEERFHKINQVLNASPVILPFPVVGSTETTDTAGNIFGAITVDRGWLRTLLPDYKWVVRAAGIVNPADANGATIYLEYRDDSATVYTLGSATFTGAGNVKAKLGPFDVFGTSGVPGGEDIASIHLRAVKLVSGTVNLLRWCIWLELRPSPFIG